MGRSQRHMREIYGIDSSGNITGARNDPTVKTIPTKSGTATQGQTLTGVNGTYDGPRNKIQRQWVRFTGATPTVIPGATNATYVVQAADVGKTIRFRNVVTNPYGTVTADSTPTATVT